MSSMDEGTGLVREDFDRDPPGYLDALRIERDDEFLGTIHEWSSTALPPTVYDPTPWRLHDQDEATLAVFGEETPDRQVLEVARYDEVGRCVGAFGIERVKGRERFVVTFSDGSTRVLARKRWWRR